MIEAIVYMIMRSMRQNTRSLTGNDGGKMLSSCIVPPTVFICFVIWKLMIRESSKPASQPGRPIIFSLGSSSIVVYRV